MTKKTCNLRYSRLFCTLIRLQKGKSVHPLNIFNSHSLILLVSCLSNTSTSNDSRALNNFFLVERLS